MLNLKEFRKEREADNKIGYHGNYKFINRTLLMCGILLGLILEVSLHGFEWLSTNWVEYVLGILLLYVVIKAIGNINLILRNQKSILNKLYKD